MDSRELAGVVISVTIVILVSLMLLVVHCIFWKKVQGICFVSSVTPKVLLLFCGMVLAATIVIMLYIWHHSHDTKSYVVDFEPSALQNLDPEYLIPCIQNKIGWPESELRVSESDYFSVTFESSLQQGANARVHQMHFSFFTVDQVGDGSLRLLTYQATKTDENTIQIVYCGQSPYEPTTIAHSKLLSILLNAVKDFPVQSYQSSTSVGGENCDYYEIQWAPNKALDAEIFSYGNAEITNNKDQSVIFYIAHCKKTDSGFGGQVCAELHYIP